MTQLTKSEEQNLKAGDRVYISVGDVNENDLCELLSFNEDEFKAKNLVTGEISEGDTNICYFYR